MSEGYKDVPAGNTDVPAGTHTEQTCAPVREVLSRVGDKWSILIVFILSTAGVLRFNEIRRRIDGISQRMLTLTLRGLERDGLLTRRVEPTVPPSVYYELTPLGKTLMEPVGALARWAQTSYPQITSAQKAFDKKAG